MKRSHFQLSRRSQKGLSLIEVMVAALIFTIILIASYLLYERGQRSYLQADVASEQQQSVRYAFDRMVITVRKAGANINPRGDRDLTDEQIEGAWESAILVRGDFDQQRECGPPTCSGPNLQGTGSPQHEMITTGNDEIVGYVLRKTGGDPTVSVNLDLSTPRNAVFSVATPTQPTNEEAKTIQAAASTVLGQTDPPYTLHQVSFDTAGNVVSTPIAENVFRLRFRYFDQNGVEIPTTNANPALNLDGTDAKRALRKEIRRIEVQLIGMAARPDFNFTDPVIYTPDIVGAPDPASAKPFRKFVLTERIGSLSLGRRGRDHGPYPTLNLTPPVELRVCKGHCKKFVVTWPAVAGVSSYQVRVTAPAAAPNPAIDERYDVLGTNIYIYTLPPWPGAETNTYTFYVRSWEPSYDAFSAWYPLAGFGGQTVLNSNTPEGVTPAPTAAQDGTNFAIKVQWTRPQWNTAPLVMTCNSTTAGNNSSSIPAPKDLELIDLGNFDVHRVRDVVGPGFPTTAANQVDNDPPNTPPGESTTFFDRTAAPCQPYFYRIVPRDACDVLAVPSDPMVAPVSFDLPPGLVPSAPTALTTSSPTTVVMVAGQAMYEVHLTWPAVTTLTDATPIGVSHYVITRQRKLEGALAFSPDATLNAWDVTTFVDQAPILDGATGLYVTYRYTVQAQFDCAVTRTSAPSPELIVPCPSIGTAVVTNPPNNAMIDSGTTEPIVVTVTGTWNRADIYVRDAGGTVVTFLTDGSTVTNGNYNFGWDTSGLSDGPYTIQAVVYQGACILATSATNVILQTPLACITLVPAGPPPTLVELIDLNGNSSNLHMRFKIQNNCAFDVLISGFAPSWTAGSPGNFVNQIDYIVNSPSIFEPVDPDCAGFPTSGLSGETMLFDIPSCPKLIPLAAGAISGFFELRFDKSISGATWGPFFVFTDQNPSPGDDLGSFTHK